MGLLAIAVTLVSPVRLQGRSAGAADNPCGCATLLDALVDKTEANYPGYRLEVLGRRDAAYQDHLGSVRRAAGRAAPGIDCTRVLQAYVAWFEDGHLFVGGRRRIETARDSALLRDAAPRVRWDESDVLEYLDERGGELDPVEGIWRDASGLTLAVVRSGMDPSGSTSSPAASFVGFILKSTKEGWGPGDVRAELTLLSDGSYDAILYDEVRAKTRPHVWTRGLKGAARLQRAGLLLHMPPTTWGKLFPVRPGQEGRIDPVDPRAPTARLVGEETVVFHVPSHVPSHASRLRALTEQYRGALGWAETLIIDVRGNEGGSTFVTDVLMPYLVTPRKRPARYLASGESMVLAAADNIAYFERVSWAPPGLVDRLRTAEAGTLVPFSDPAASDGVGSGEPETAVATARPRHVAILTDAMTVSAAEAFVLKAMRNEKVTLFGQPTGSSIDYQTVGVVRFGCPEAGLYFGYPTIVGSDRLPEGGVRPTGIVPDVPLDPADPDPISTIIDYYRRHRPGS